MTTWLRTPYDWPRIILARDEPATAAAATDFNAALERGAFTGLRVAVEELGPDGTIAAIERSGLRGRGGAGFPAGAKWRQAASTPAAATPASVDGMARTVTPDTGAASNR